MLFTCISRLLFFFSLILSVQVAFGQSNCDYCNAALAKDYIQSNSFHSLERQIASIRDEKTFKEMKNTYKENIAGSARPLTSKFAFWGKFDRATNYSEFQQQMNSLSQEESDYLSEINSSSSVKFVTNDIAYSAWNECIANCNSSMGRQQSSMTIKVISENASGILVEITHNRLKRDRTRNLEIRILNYNDWRNYDINEIYTISDTSRPLLLRFRRNSNCQLPTTPTVIEIQGDEYISNTNNNVFRYKSYYNDVLTNLELKIERYGYGVDGRIMQTVFIPTRGYHISYDMEQREPSSIKLYSSFNGNQGEIIDLKAIPPNGKEISINHGDKVLKIMSRLTLDNNPIKPAYVWKFDISYTGCR